MTSNVQWPITAVRGRYLAEAEDFPRFIDRVHIKDNLRSITINANRLAVMVTTEKWGENPKALKVFEASETDTFPLTIQGKEIAPNDFMNSVLGEVGKLLSVYELEVHFEVGHLTTLKITCDAYRHDTDNP